MNNQQNQALDEIRQQVSDIVAVTVDQKRLTVPEAARYLGMSEDTIRTLAREKDSALSKRQGRLQERTHSISFPNAG